MTSKKPYQTRSALKDQKVKLSLDRRLGGDLVEFTESEEKLAGTSTDQQLKWDHSVDLESPEKKEFSIKVDADKFKLNSENLQKENEAYYKVCKEELLKKQIMRRCSTN